jgi:hypothetical protein
MTLQFLLQSISTLFLTQVPAGFTATACPGMTVKLL